MEEKNEQFELQRTKKNPGELYFLLLLFIINGAFFIESLKLKGIMQGLYNESGFIPQIISAVSIIMISILIIHYIRGNDTEKKPFEALRYLFSRDVIILLVLVILYAFVLEILHFKLATFLFLYISMLMFDRNKPVQKFIISLGTLVSIVVIFAYLFQVILP
ncbi:tripartite tricarboxylate transporter TctB family protein [Thermoanaerobacterium sp. DL9XJH110]|uniref:tripartite tricarboxylate transporter TctB family protein n=1 Tax=Thermoanaerobacterium sp. DL9XJH110 TaxID=3386643 RepID=UPI003BB5AD69